MQAPLVSIIVPIYNVELYLRECLDSIINQSYINLDIILVDDGSTDNSLDIALEYASKDSRILVISKPNGGLSSARNMGLEFIKGTRLRELLDGGGYCGMEHITSYINNSFDKTTKNISKSMIDNHFKTCSSNFIKTTLADSTTLIIQELPNNIIHFVDSDDYIMLDCIEVCLKEMLDRGVEICVHNLVEYHETTKEFKPLSMIKQSEYNKAIDYLITNQFYHFYFAWQGVFNAGILNRYNLRFTYGIYYEDHDFGTILFALAKGLFCMDYQGMVYRKRIDSITTTETYTDFPKAMPPILEEIKGYFSSYKALRAYFKAYCLCKIALNIYDFNKSRHDKATNNFLNTTARMYAKPYLEYVNMDYYKINHCTTRIWCINPKLVKLLLEIRIYCRHPKKIAKIFGKCQ